jgi:hypothetical protein
MIIFGLFLKYFEYKKIIIYLKGQKSVIIYHGLLIKIMFHIPKQFHLTCNLVLQCWISICMFLNHIQKPTYSILISFHWVCIIFKARI